MVYEDVVSNQEKETRELLEFWNLPFEEDCLRFYETKRAVKTASSEQVRQPIYRKGVKHWQNYEHFLDGLKNGLLPLNKLKWSSNIFKKHGGDNSLYL